MNVTVQVIGSPEDVAIFLREIGVKNPEVSISTEEVVTEVKEPPATEDAFSGVPDPGQEAIEETPDKKIEEESKVTYAQLQHALKMYGLRYQQRHDSEVSTAKDALLRICEKIGGAEKGEGSKGIKKELYAEVYKFCLEDNDI